MKVTKRGRPSKVEALTKELEAKTIVAKQLEGSLKEARSDEAAAMKRIAQLEKALSEVLEEQENGALTHRQSAFMFLAHMFFDHE